MQLPQNPRIKITDLKNIVLYGTPVCPKCSDVHLRLQLANIDHEYVKLDSVEKQKEFHLLAPGARMVPVMIAKTSEADVVIYDVVSYIDGQIC
jgi:glutaredoxin